MAERNNSHLLDGGDDPMGMTDNQYKGMLLDQLEDWSWIWQSRPGTPKSRKRSRNRFAKSMKS